MTMQHAGQNGDTLGAGRPGSGPASRQRFTNQIVTPRFRFVATIPVKFSKDPNAPSYKVGQELPPSMGLAATFDPRTQAYTLSIKGKALYVWDGFTGKWIHEAGADGYHTPVKFKTYAVGILDRDRPCPGNLVHTTNGPDCTVVVDWKQTPHPEDGIVSEQLSASRPPTSGRNRRVATRNDRVRLNAQNKLVYVVQAGDNDAKILRYFNQPPEQYFNLLRLNPHKRTDRVRGIPKFRRLVVGERIFIPMAWQMARSSPANANRTRGFALLAGLAAADLKLAQQGRAIRLFNLGKGADHWGRRTPALGKMVATVGEWGCPDGQSPTGEFDDDWNPICAPSGNGGGGDEEIPVDVPDCALNWQQPCGTSGDPNYVDGTPGLISCEGNCIPFEDPNVGMSCPQGMVGVNGDPNNGCVFPGQPCDLANPTGAIYDENGFCMEVGAPGPTPEQQACGGVGCNGATSYWSAGEGRCLLNSYGQDRLNAADQLGGGWEYDPCMDTYYNHVLSPPVDGQGSLPGVPPPAECPEGYKRELVGGPCVKVATGGGGGGKPGGGGGSGGGGNEKPAAGKAAEKGLSMGAKFGIGAALLAGLALLAKAASGPATGGGGKKKAPAKKKPASRPRQLARR